MTKQMSPIQEQFEKKRCKGAVEVRYTQSNTYVSLLDCGSTSAVIRNPTPDELNGLADYFNGGSIPGTLGNRVQGSLGRIKKNADVYRCKDWRTALQLLAIKDLHNPNQKGAGLLTAFMVKVPKKALKSRNKRQIKVSLEFVGQPLSEHLVSYQQAWDQGHQILDTIDTIDGINPRIQANLDTRTDSSILENQVQIIWSDEQDIRSISELESEAYWKLAIALIRAAVNVSGNPKWREQVQLDKSYKVRWKNAYAN